MENKQENTQNEKKQPKNQKNSIPGFNGGSRPNLGKPRFNIGWIYAAILIGVLAYNYYAVRYQVVKTDWKEFKNEMLETGDVERLVVVNDKIVEIYIKKDRLKEKKYEKIIKREKATLNEAGPHFQFNIGSLENFEKRLEEAQAAVPEAEKIYPESEIRKDFMGDIINIVIWIVVLIAVWMLIFRKMGAGMAGPGGPGNIFNVGKSRAQLFDKEATIKIDFKDVAGLEEAKIEIKEIVDFLKNPKKYTELGGKIPKGALLVGPPGTGKTLLAKAVAGEANVPFFSLSGSDFVEMFVGVGASRVRDLFRQAKEKSPCIVFIDEIDAIGRARGKNVNFAGNDERENTLNQLLTEMDGFGTNSGVIILAATNRADILDRALLRAGRFDRQIHVELPDINERRDIFKVHSRNLKMADEISMEFLANQTPGFSGADIANVCNEAALIAARKEKKAIEKQDFLDAIDRIVGGLEKKNKIISPHEKKTIAYHEAGHATVSWLLEYANPLVKVTIIPRGKSLGAAWYLPEERQITHTDQLLDEMCSALAGRASEEVTFGTVSTGALNDLERVTKQAYAMVVYYGLSNKVGNISYYDSSGQSEYAFSKPYSEQTAELIDGEVKTIIESQYERAKSVLREHQPGLKELAEILLEKEVLFSEDLERIFGPRKGVVHHSGEFGNGTDQPATEGKDTIETKDVNEGQEVNP